MEQLVYERATLLYVNHALVYDNKLCFLVVDTGNIIGQYGIDNGYSEPVNGFQHV